VTASTSSSMNSEVRTSRRSAGVVIVGGGECGAKAAMSLRKYGWSGAVTVFGAEPIPAYERPPPRSSDAAGHRSTRSMTNSCSASGISSGAGACFGFNSLALQSSRHSLTAGCPGASDKGTEILTGVLEASSA